MNEVSAAVGKKASHSWHRKTKTAESIWERRKNEVCLKTPDNKNFVFYKEKTETIRIDLSGAPGPLRAAAVNAAGAYKEINLGSLRPVEQTVNLPAHSDWAITVGKF